MIGHPKHSAPMRARVIGSHEPTGQRNYQTKPISNNQQGINGLRRVSGTAGKPGLAKLDGSLRRKLPRGTGNGERNPSLCNSSGREQLSCSRRKPHPGACPRSVSNRTTTAGAAKLPSNKMTKQTQFFITAIDPAARASTYGYLKARSTRCLETHRSRLPPQRLTEPRTTQGSRQRAVRPPSKTPGVFGKERPG